MKIRLSFKTPDVVDDAVEEEFPTTIPNYETDDFDEMEPDSDEYLEVMVKREELTEFLKQWVGYGEYVSIEFDQEANTAVVLKAVDWIR